MGQEIIWTGIHNPLFQSRKYYPNGAIEMSENGIRQYVLYNTGDIVLFGRRLWGEEYVRGIITHDGLRYRDCAEHKI
jgi:hypothetical protein